MGCLDRKNGQWLYLPNDGGLYDQDEELMLIWNIIRNEYFRVINDPVMQAELEKLNGVK
jgi:hypothetical protein